MQKKFYDLIESLPKVIELLDGSKNDVQSEIERYKEVLKKYPRDLQIVGLGTNVYLKFV